MVDPCFSNNYRRSGKLIRQKCGRPIKRGKLNMDAWIVNVKCGGDCTKTDITLSAENGQESRVIFMEDHIQ